ncbi:MAG TPA: RluA family pseudouridine synthase [Isosphaeraceae bacterium]|jgi:23S rRNA pseudouridine1911/1915/1917 synthase|nr:RluA family pseudouridine synthase [Isosphaeraceae bacterium]
MTEPLSILFEDEHCLVVFKPSDVSTQAPLPSELTLENAVRHYLNPADPWSVYLGTVHRLDRPVSGVMLWAKTPKAARRLAAQFASRQAHKEYWAIVEGTPGTDAGLWDDWLLFDRSTGVGRAQVCSRQAPRARQAVTRFQRSEAVRLPPGCCWLKLWPETGRTHQIRVQAAFRNLPIRGDRTYGGSAMFQVGIALHARALTVNHPILRQPMTFVAPLPEGWQAQGIELDATGPEEPDRPLR